MGKQCLVGVMIRKQQQRYEAWINEINCRKVTDDMISGHISQLLL